MNVQAPTATYHSELCRAMTWLGEQKRVVFVGQGVGNPGTSMSDTLAGVADVKFSGGIAWETGLKIEFPVAEEMQVGMCVGMSLAGWVPVCIIPRWNFALRAADQIVNHLDRLPIYSAGGYRPKVIVRVAAPSVSPFDPGPQHDADFTEAFRLMLRTVRVVTLDSIDAIVPAYQAAFDSPDSTILVEFTHAYRDARGQWPKKESF
jgi:pyruvate/2-oxoglutarate/acetoin dehydrogenase E1 component